MIKLSPISIAATAQEYTVEITENLCQPICLTNSVIPNGTVSFSVGQTKVSDGIAYIEVLANGNITYQPVGCSCNSKVKQFSESFWVGFVGTSIPTVAITTTAPIQLADNVKCNNRAYGWTMVQSVTITPTF